MIKWFKNLYLREHKKKNLPRKTWIQFPVPHNTKTQSHTHRAITVVFSLGTRNNGLSGCQ